MDKPKVSIIVPIYNVEPYLRRCVDSVLIQSLADIEIILVDDGSHDGCPCICDEYAAMDNRIQVIHKMNGGLSDARNKGLEIVSGEYVGFVDGDDRIGVKMYETLYINAKKHNAEVSFCNYARVVDGVTKPKEQEILTDCLNLCGLDLQDCFSDHCFAESVCTCIFKTSFLIDNSINFFDNSVVLYEDTLFIYEVYLSAKKIACTDELYYYYVHRTGSLINSPDKMRKISKKVTMYRELYYYTLRNKKTNISTSPAGVIALFWEDWIASVLFYINRNGREGLVVFFKNIEAKSFLKTAAFSLMCGKANRMISKRRDLSVKYRLHLRYMALCLLTGKYEAFLKGYLQ